jgi:hypothetical protein
MFPLGVVARKLVSPWSEIISFVSEGRNIPVPLTAERIISAPIVAAVLLFVASVQESKRRLL